MSQRQYGLIVADLIEMLEILPPNAQVRIGYNAGPIRPAFQITHITELHDDPRRPYNAIGDTLTVWLGIDQVDRQTESPTAPVQVWYGEGINGGDDQP